MIYCDLDGVLADFNQAFKSITGKFPMEVSRRELWSEIDSRPDYWLTLEMTSDADILLKWLSAHPYQILTGLPVIGYEQAEKQKRLWVEQYIGSDIPVICCLSKDKALYCQPGDILIDDYEQNICQWEKVGGIGILHVNAADTVQRLSQIVKSHESKFMSLQ